MRPQIEFSMEVKRAAIVEAFSHVLGNTWCLQNAALLCEWNVRGPLAPVAAELFHQQAGEMLRALDPLADCIRLTGHPVRIDFSDRVLPDEMQHESLIDPRVRPLLQVLSLGHENTIISIEAAADIALELGDRRSLQLLDARRTAHEDHLVQLQMFWR